MVNFIANLIISWVAVWLAAYFTPGVTVDGIVPAILVAVVLWLVNATVGSVLRILTFPINFLTLGLISTIIWFLMLLLTDSLVDGFAISNSLSGLIFAVLLGLISSALGTQQK